jgi:hypothetical protein
MRTVERSRSRSAEQCGAGAGTAEDIGAQPRASTVNLIIEQLKYAPASSVTHSFVSRALGGGCRQRSREHSHNNVVTQVHATLGGVTVDDLGRFWSDSSTRFCARFPRFEQNREMAAIRICHQNKGGGTIQRKSRDGSDSRNALGSLRTPVCLVCRQLLLTPALDPLQARSSASPPAARGTTPRPRTCPAPTPSRSRLSARVRSFGAAATRPLPHICSPRPAR